MPRKNWLVGSLLLQYRKRKQGHKPMKQGNIRIFPGNIVKSLMPTDNTPGQLATYCVPFVNTLNCAYIHIIHSLNQSGTRCLIQHGVMQILHTHTGLHTHRHALHRISDKNVVKIFFYECHNSYHIFTKLLRHDSLITAGDTTT